jgi:hypothetical protein
MVQDFRFYKELDGRWYVEIPQWEGSKEDLEMVQGADTMLDLISGEAKECFLTFSDVPFEDAEELVLEHVREPNLGGGGDYFLNKYEGETTLLRLWLCEVTNYVFKGLPERIYFRKVQKQ